MTQTNITPADLYAIYLETAELLRNRPDAVLTKHGSGKNKSWYWRKMDRIRREAGRMVPRTPTEKIFLEAILGREVTAQEETVKVQWFNLK